MMSWLTRRAARPRDPFDLDTPLLRWSKKDAWTIRDACAGGCLVLGATGSGKTTGPGRALAVAMLRAGFGGLILTAKPDERALWERYIREAGRAEDDLVVFGPEQPWRFNFLDYELNRPGRAGGLVENVVNVLSGVLEVAARDGGSGDGREEGGYWRRAGRQMCRCAVSTLALAKGRITVSDLQRLVVSAPTSLEQVRSPQWKESSACYRWLMEADKRVKSPQEKEDFELNADYWLCEFPAMAEKTRSIHISGFTSMVDVLNRSPLRELLCGETNITPEACEQGKIILLDLPILDFREVGLYAQTIWKVAFQRSIERRDTKASPRPVMLWADEAHHFVLPSYDMLFATTCRSARVAMILLSQNISNFFAALGGSEKGRAEATSLFSNLNSKILCANAEPVNNEWAAGVIGRTRRVLASGNQSYSAEDERMASLGLDWLGKTGSTSSGFSEAWEHEVEPSVFSKLRMGGPPHWLVDAIVFQNGRVFSETGKSWMRVSFQQRI